LLIFTFLDIFISSPILETLAFGFGVTAGFGYLGFPGRVGFYPEITEITITKG
jgi:predicted MPP superfamily phosphohydrolase